MEVVMILFWFMFIIGNFYDVLAVLEFDDVILMKLVDYDDGFFVGFGFVIIDFEGMEVN